MPGPFPDDDDTIDVDIEVLAQVREAARHARGQEGSFDDEDTIEDEVSMPDGARGAAIRRVEDSAGSAVLADEVLAVAARARHDEVLAGSPSMRVREGSFEGSLPGSLEGSLPGSLEGSLPGSLEGSLPGSLEGSLPVVAGSAAKTA